MKDSGDEMEEMDEVKVVQDDKTKKKDEKKETECVFLIDKGKAKLTSVKTGIQDNNYIEIKEGLKEGQEVIVAPYSAIAKMLKDGDIVEIVKKDKLFEKEKK